MVQPNLGPIPALAPSLPRGHARNEIKEKSESVVGCDDVGHVDGCYSQSNRRAG